MSATKDKYNYENFDQEEQECCCFWFFGSKKEPTQDPPPYPETPPTNSSLWYYDSDSISIMQDTQSRLVEIGTLSPEDITPF